MIKAAVSVKMLTLAFSLGGLQLICFCCGLAIIPYNVAGYSGEPIPFSQLAESPIGAPEPTFTGITWKLNCGPDVSNPDVFGWILCNSGLGMVLSEGGEFGLLSSILLGLGGVGLGWFALFRLLPFLLWRGPVGIWRTLRRRSLRRRAERRDDNILGEYDRLTPSWRYKLGFRPQARNPKLQSAFDEIFRREDKIPGGTAGAIREELLTGQPVGTRPHIQKGIDRARQLRNLIRDGNLDPGDMNIAKEVLEDLLYVLKIAGKTI